MAKAEVYFTKNGNCHVPKFDMPKKSSYHTLVLSAGDYKLLSCGGEAYEKKCFRLDVNNGKWKLHSNLKRKRLHAFGITMPKGVYVFGGTSHHFAGQSRLGIQIRKSKIDLNMEALRID